MDTQRETPKVHTHTSAETELSQVAEAGLRLGLERWHEVCPCCFSEAYPEGLEQAVEKLKG